MHTDQSLTHNHGLNSNLEVAIYNNHAHYQHLYDLIAELKSYGTYTIGSDEPLSEELQDKVDQTIVDYLNGTHLFMCFNPEVNKNSKIYPPEGSLCGLLSLSIKEIPVHEPKSGIDAMQSTMLTITALKGAMQSASKGDFDLSEHFKAVSALNPSLAQTNTSSDIASTTAQDTTSIADPTTATDSSLEGPSDTNQEAALSDPSSLSTSTNHNSMFDHMSSEDLKAKVAAAQATLDALNALNAQKAAQEQAALEQAQAQEQSQDGNNSDSSDSAKEHKEEQAKQEHYCFINRVYIRPQERHQGAATKLLEQAISFAKEQECQQIILSTIATYQSALNLYQKMGFTELDPNKLPENIKVKARTIYLGLTLQEPENSHA